MRERLVEAFQSVVLGQRKWIGYQVTRPCWCCVRSEFAAASSWPHQAACYDMQDMIVFQYLRSPANCSGLYEAPKDASAARDGDLAMAEPCYVFGVRPSLVQHIGAHSSVFGDGQVHTNTRFHLAQDFTSTVVFPAMVDLPATW